MTRKNGILFGSLFITAVSFVLMCSSKIGFCPNASYSQCAQQADSIAESLIPAVPFFVFSLLTYFMRDAVYKTWLSFALPWLLVSIAAIALTPDVPAPALGGPGFGFGKGDLALLLTALFVLVSAVIIAWKYIADRPKTAR